MTDKTRIKRFANNILQFEAKSTAVHIARLEQQVRQHRNNPSDAGAIDQMKEVNRLQELRDYKSALDKEIDDRRKTGPSRPDPAVIEVVKKDNPPIPPALTPVHKPGAAEEAPLEGEELPIKVMDQGVPRAWRPSDGPIHGPTPADTITDVSKTTNKDSVG